MYAVLTYTICDGWINCWTVTDREGNSWPDTYETRGAAQDEIESLASDMPDYSVDDYKIVKIENQYDHYNNGE